MHDILFHRSSNRAAADPIRLVIVLPRLSDVSDLRKAICQMLSPAAQKTPSSSNASLNLVTKGQNGSAPVGQVILPENLTLLECCPEGEGGLVRTILEDRESILHLIEAISRSNSASASASAANLLQRSESGVDVYLRTGSPVEPAHAKAIAARHRADSANSSPGQAGGDPYGRAVLENANGGMVLHVGARPDANGLDVAPHHGAEPDRRCGADDHVADDDRRVDDEGGGVESRHAAGECGDHRDGDLRRRDVRGQSRPCPTRERLLDDTMARTKGRIGNDRWAPSRILDPSRRIHVAG